jgi:hypothetical protein
METVRTKEDLKKRQLKGILFALQAFLEEEIGKVEAAYALNEIGEKTELTKKLEKLIDRPLDHIYETSNQIDNEVLKVLYKLVERYLKAHKDKINSAYYYKSDLVSHFSIVLDKDTEENRDCLYEFLDSYEEEKISRRYPIIFNFLDNDMVKGLISPLRIEL